jgi:hypothetical protein
MLLVRHSRTNFDPTALRLWWSDCVIPVAFRGATAMPSSQRNGDPHPWSEGPDQEHQVEEEEEGGGGHE